MTTIEEKVKKLLGEQQWSLLVSTQQIEDLQAVNAELNEKLVEASVSAKKPEKSKKV